MLPPLPYPTTRWRAYSYDEITARDKVNLDIFWLRDESLEDTENLPDRRAKRSMQTGPGSLSNEIPFKLS